LQQSLLKHEERSDSRIQVDYLVLGWKIDRVKNYYRFLSCTTFVSVVRLSMFSFRLRGFQPFSSAKLRRITEMTKLLFKF